MSHIVVRVLKEEVLTNGNGGTGGTGTQVLECPPGTHETGRIPSGALLIPLCSPDLKGEVEKGEAEGRRPPLADWRFGIPWKILGIALALGVGLFFIWRD